MGLCAKYEAPAGVRIFYYSLQCCMNHYALNWWQCWLFTESIESCYVFWVEEHHKKIFWNLLKTFSCPIDKKKSKFHHWDSISFRFLKFSPQVLRHEKHCKMMDIFLWFSSSQSTYIINNNFVQNYPFSMYSDYF